MNPRWLLKEFHFRKNALPELPEPQSSSNPLSAALSYAKASRTGFESLLQRLRQTVCGYHQ